MVLGVDIGGHDSSSQREMQSGAHSAKEAPGSHPAPDDAELRPILAYHRIDSDLATSGQPDPDQFGAIRNAGFAVVLNLALPSSDRALAHEGALVTQLGMAYFHLPVSFEHPRIEDYEAFRQVLSAWKGRRVWVHCAANMRVSCFVFLYRVLEEGLRESDAARDLQAIWNPDDTWSVFMTKVMRETKPSRTIETGQRVGTSLPDWKTPVSPERVPCQGQYARLQPLDAKRDAESLWEELGSGPNDSRWTYLPYGPFREPDSFFRWLQTQQDLADPVFFSIHSVHQTRALGLASYMRIQPEHGSIEIGHIHFGSKLQRSTAATEALYLMMEQGFRLGYRRCEWKCDQFNGPSRQAAERLGFVFEGVFRHATVYKGRSRDTAWYSIVDSEWPRLRSAIRRWLAPENFDSEGRQRMTLKESQMHSTGRTA